MRFRKWPRQETWISQRGENYVIEKSGGLCPYMVLGPPDDSHSQRFRLPAGGTLPLGDAEALANRHHEKRSGREVGEGGEQ